MLEQSESLLTFEIQRMQTTKCPLHECNQKTNAQLFQFQDYKSCTLDCIFSSFYATDYLLVSITYEIYECHTKAFEAAINLEKNTF